MRRRGREIQRLAGDEFARAYARFYGSKITVGPSPFVVWFDTGCGINAKTIRWPA